MKLKLLALCVLVVLVAATVLSGCAGWPNNGTTGVTTPTTTHGTTTKGTTTAPTTTAPRTTAPTTSSGATTGGTTTTGTSTTAPTTASTTSPTTKAPSTRTALSPLKSGHSLAGHSTEIMDYAKGRLRNITVAVEKLNGVTLEPGEVFSFNDTIGPRTKEAGFRKATVFINGEKIKELGGGICQVSSTLYSAVRLGGFDVVERHEHGQEVDYAAEGMDAAVYYGELDFKFRNNMQQAIQINASFRDYIVTVQITAA